MKAAIPAPEPEEPTQLGGMSFEFVVIGRTEPAPALGDTEDVFVPPYEPEPWEEQEQEFQEIND